MDSALLTIVVAGAAVVAISAILVAIKKRGDKAVEAKFEALVAAYRVAYGDTASGRKFLNSIGPSSAVRLGEVPDAATSAAGAGVLASALGTGLFGAVISAGVAGLSAAFPAFGINAGKTERQIAAEHEIAAVLKEWLRRERALQWQVAGVICTALIVSVIFSVEFGDYAKPPSKMPVATQQPRPAPNNTAGPTSLTTVKVGMSAAEVLAAVGSPSFKAEKSWFYLDRGWVRFNDDGIVLEVETAAESSGRGDDAAATSRDE